MQSVRNEVNARGVCIQSKVILVQDLFQKVGWYKLGQMTAVHLLRGISQHLRPALVAIDKTLILNDIDPGNGLFNDRIEGNFC